jgi:hypothetical protein
VLIILGPRRPSRPSSAGAISTRKPGRNTSGSLSAAGSLPWRKTAINQPTGPPTGRPSTRPSSPGCIRGFSTKGRHSGCNRTLFSHGISSGHGRARDSQGIFTLSRPAGASCRGRRHFSLVGWGYGGISPRHQDRTAQRSISL